MWLRLVDVPISADLGCLVTLLMMPFPLPHGRRDLAVVPRGKSEVAVPGGGQLGNPTRAVLRRC